MDDQRLAGLDPTQHAAGVVTKVSDRDGIHVAVMRHMLGASLVLPPAKRTHVIAVEPRVGGGADGAPRPSTGRWLTSESACSAAAESARLRSLSD
jgi:hypothetical protein